MKTIEKGSVVAMLAAGAMMLVSCEPSETTASPLVNVSTESDGTTIVTSEKSSALSTVATASLADWLQFMYEEEKVARDIYLALNELYPQNTFRNIARAENTHMEAVQNLMTLTGVENTGSSSAGIFNNAELQALYTELYEKGKASLVDALKVGALVEEADILDLADVYELDPKEEYITLAEALMLGSRNHLRAFVKSLVKNGVTYEPVFLEADAYTEIISTEMEKKNNFFGNCDQQVGNKYSKGKGYRGGR